MGKIKAAELGVNGVGVAAILIHARDFPRSLNLFREGEKGRKGGEGRMNLKHRGSALLSVLISGALIMQLVGCGYLLHPERRGQRGGNIDPGIAILDGLGLLLFIVPGLIAFAVDFTTGTIYYPKGRKSDPKKSKIDRVRLDPKELDENTICQKVREYTGCPRNFTFGGAKILPLNQVEEIEANLEKVMRSGYQTHSFW